MARKIPEDRFETLIRAATEVFIARGYRLTQMADVAEAVGVAKGTLNVYVESKEALFRLCLDDATRRGRGGDPIGKPAVLPVPTPVPGELSLGLQRELLEHGQLPRLAAALALDTATDIRRELDELLGEMYDKQRSYAVAIKLVETAVGHPELGDEWQRSGREGTRDLVERYLVARGRAGQLRTFENPRLAARTVIESIATWAMHILWDPQPEVFDDEAMRENTIDFLVRGLLPGSGDESESDEDS